MAKPEIALNPPQPIAKAALAHRKKLELERDALRTGAAELALKSAQGDTAAQAALWAIPAKQAGLQFEIDQNHAACELATKQDSDAEAAWRTLLQTMDPEDLIAGIGGDSCPGLCKTSGSCVITATYPYAGGNAPTRSAKSLGSLVATRTATGNFCMPRVHSARAFLKLPAQN
jgi:hypothetical protein